MYDSMGRVGLDLEKERIVDDLPSQSVVGTWYLYSGGM